MARDNKTKSKIAEAAEEMQNEREMQRRVLFGKMPRVPDVQKGLMAGAVRLPEDMALKQLKEMYGEEGLIRMYNKNPKMFSEQINTISNKINKDRNGM